MYLVKLSTFKVLLILSSRPFQSPQIYTYGVAISHLPTTFPHNELSYLDLYEVKIYIKQKSFIESFFWGSRLWDLLLYLYICLACIACQCMSCQCNTCNELCITSSSPSFSWLWFLLCFIQSFYLIQGEIILVSWLFLCATWFCFIWLGRDFT